MLHRGYAAASVDAICAAADCTKGAFFHRFPSKQALAVEALAHYRQRTSDALAAAPVLAIADPLERTLAYIEFLAELLLLPDVPNACLIGNLAQETAPANKAIQAACGGALTDWAAEIALDLAAAKAERAPDARFEPKNVALHLVAVTRDRLCSRRRWTIGASSLRRSVTRARTWSNCSRTLRDCQEITESIAGSR